MRRTTTPTVDAIEQLNITGNVIPRAWFTAALMQTPSGRVNLPAIMILAEIIYFYRPTIKVDELTGKTVSVSKKFLADKMQRNYESLAELFGFSKETAIAACKFLKKVGLINIEHRTVVTARGVRMGNVTFLEPIPDKVREITYPVADAEAPPPPHNLPQEGKFPERENPSEAIGEIPPDLMGKFPRTNTESSTEITTEIKNLPLAALAESSTCDVDSGKHTPDPRWTLIRDDLKKYWDFKNPGFPMPWNPKVDGRAVRLFLEQNPRWGPEQWQVCLRHRAKSDVPHGDHVHKWLPSLTRYAEGPRDRFDKLVTQGGGVKHEQQRQLVEHNRAGLEEFLREGLGEAATGRGVPVRGVPALEPFVRRRE